MHKLFFFLGEMISTEMCYNEKYVVCDSIDMRDGAASECYEVVTELF